MMKPLVSIILTILLLYIFVCGGLYLSQRSFIYYPTSAVQATGAQNLLLESAGETLRIWHIDNNSPRAIIYFGGNAEDVSWNTANFKAIYPDHSVYLVNYRGYGGSSGKPSEAGLFEDALAIYDYLKEKHVSISVIGRSLGSGIAVYLASVRELEKLVLVTPFDSLENIAKRAFPVFPISILLRDKYKSIEYAGNIQAPTMVLIAEHDEIIPRKSTEALLSALPESLVEVRIIEDADHNSIGGYPEYSKYLREFL